MNKDKKPLRILMVCLGNICRSPTAEAVFRQRLQHLALNQWLEVDSAGTGDWHVGSAPDARSMAVAQARGYEMAQLRARQVADQDFHDFDYLFAMDAQNLRDLQARCPTSLQGKLSLFLEVLEEGPREVPDPYYGGEEGFHHVLALLEEAADRQLQVLCQRHQLPWPGRQG